MKRQSLCFAALTFLLFAGGCPSPVREEVIVVKESNDPLSMPRSVLKRYAEGQPLSSEVTSFPKMVEDVRKVDAPRADILEKGLAEIQKASPTSRATIAKGLLEKLKPSMN